MRYVPTTRHTLATVKTTARRGTRERGNGPRGVAHIHMCPLAAIPPRSLPPSLQPDRGEKSRKHHIKDERGNNNTTLKISGCRKGETREEETSRKRTAHSSQQGVGRAQQDAALAAVVLDPALEQDVPPHAPFLTPAVFHLPVLQQEKLSGTVNERHTRTHSRTDGAWAWA